MNWEPTTLQPAATHRLRVWHVPLARLEIQLLSVRALSVYQAPAILFVDHPRLLRAVPVTQARFRMSVAAVSVRRVRRAPTIPCTVHRLSVCSVPGGILATARDQQFAIRAPSLLMLQTLVLPPAQLVLQAIFVPSKLLL